MSILSRLLGEPSHKVGLVITASVISTIAVLSFANFALSGTTPEKIIPSPRETELPQLSKEEQDGLPYPPNAFPGARDVVSPYGTIRVYEWGPETGKKALFAHGISTPCVSLGGVAKGLVKKVCRVMLFDLWGRGYSDMIDLPLDSRLYTTQILLAITSSPIPWTPSGFSLVGYSLGGGIAVDSATDFPAMVNSVVLLAPGGLMRPYHFSWLSRVLYHGNFPESILEWLTMRRIGKGDKSAVRDVTGDQDHPTTGDELNGIRDPRFENATIALDNSRPDVTIADVVQWQIDKHEGFVKSFISSLKHSSIEAKHETWRKLKMRKDKVLVIVGTTDPVIIARELHDGAAGTIGQDNIEWRDIQSGHEFPISHADEVVDMISEVWGL